MFKILYDMVFEYYELKNIKNGLLQRVSHFVGIYHLFYLTESKIKT